MRLKFNRRSWEQSLFGQLASNYYKPVQRRQFSSDVKKRQSPNCIWNQLTSSCSVPKQSLLSRSLLRGRGLWSTGPSGKAPSHSWTGCPCPRPCSRPPRDGCSDDPWAPSALQTTACPSLSWWAKCRSWRPAGGGQDQERWWSPIFSFKKWSGAVRPLCMLEFLEKRWG